MGAIVLVQSVAKPGTEKMLLRILFHIASHDILHMFAQFPYNQSHRDQEAILFGFHDTLASAASAP